MTYSTNSILFINKTCMAQDKRGLASADKETRERVAAEGGKAKAKEDETSSSESRKDTERRSDSKEQGKNNSDRENSSDRGQGNKQGNQSGKK